MRIGLYIVGVALTALGVVVSVACRDTLVTFEPTPLQLLVTIGEGARAEAPFAVQQGGEYEIQFDCRNPVGLRPFEYGKWDAAVKSAVINWEVMSGQRRVGAGSTKTYPENWYGRGGGDEPPRSGHEIGRFTADEGTPYTLRVTVESGDRQLNAHQPRVNVELNGQQLSDISNVDEAREFLFVQGKRVAILGLAIVALAVALQLFARRGAG